MFNYLLEQQVGQRFRFRRMICCCSHRRSSVVGLCRKGSAALVKGSACAFRLSALHNRPPAAFGLA
eukprot:359522-Chlamydomonas_euryale.AAC.5